MVGGAADRRRRPVTFKLWWLCVCLLFESDRSDHVRTGTGTVKVLPIGRGGGVAEGAAVDIRTPLPLVPPLHLGWGLPSLPDLCCW